MSWFFDDNFCFTFEYVVFGRIFIEWFLFFVSMFNEKAFDYFI